MLRNDFVLIGCGGAGGRLVDCVLSQDARFTGYFINSSITDLNTLEHKDDIDKNYLCISNNNGAGRSRSIGKRFASKHGWTILDTIKSFPQKNIYLVSSFGGGSGSSIVSVLLNAIRKMTDEGEFDKTINLIGILPRLDSSDDILKNTVDTWNEIFSYGIVNNMFFIDNSNIIDGVYYDEETINEEFASLFDSIFEIPVVNGRNFDNGNLGRVLSAQGCTYVYNLPDGCSSVEQALKQADSISILAKMYKKGNTVVDSDGREKVKCEFVGTSFNNENYNHEDVLDFYKWETGDFNGYNEENNLVIISGCLPPLYSIQVIKAELEDRERERAKNTKPDFSKFVVDFNSEVSASINTSNKPKTTVALKPKENSSSNSIKKSMKKNLFDMY